MNFILYSERLETNVDVLCTVVIHKKFQTRFLKEKNIIVVLNALIEYAHVLCFRSSTNQLKYG